MKRMAVMIASLCLIATSWAQSDHTEKGTTPMQTVNDSRMVAPALEKYAQGPLAELWKRPGLTPRDRSIVTIAALVGRNQTIEMPYYFNLALDNGVKPREISEIITHLAFYSGWANAMSAVAVAKEVFAERKIGADQLPPASPALLPLDEDAEVKRATAVEQQFGKVAPGIVHYTADVLFRDLWLRPDLAPRDRSLVTVSALIASGLVNRGVGTFHNVITNIPENNRKFSFHNSYLCPFFSFVDNRNLDKLATEGKKKRERPHALPAFRAPQSRRHRRQNAPLCATAEDRIG